VQPGTTRDDVVAMGHRYGFTLFDYEQCKPNSSPSCYVNLEKGRHLEVVIRNLLASEENVVTINLNYFEN